MPIRSLAPVAMGAEPPRTRVWLRFHDHPDFELSVGVTIVGRGDGCELLLDDPLISRRHACFVVDEREVTLKDLGSTNGVLVNGVKVDDLQVVVPGDQITLGHHQAELCWVPFSAADRPPPRGAHSGRPAADTVIDQRPTGPRAPAVEESAEPEDTHQSRMLELLSGVAEKAFELGRGADAERLLRRPLEAILARVEDGSLIDAREAGEAGLLAVRLARATGQGQWIDYVFKLFGGLQRLPPTSVIDELHLAVRVAPAVSISEFRHYLDLMRGVQHAFGPAERFLVRRLEGLAGVLVS